MLATLGACQHRLKDPTPPNTEAVEKIYDNPKGTLQAPSLEELTQEFAEKSQVLLATGPSGGVGTLLDGISKNEGVVKATGPGEASNGSRLLAVINATHVCRGPEGDDVIDAKKNGTITLTAKGGEKGLFPIAWGRFNNCVDHTDQRPFTIDGEFSLTLRKRSEGENVLFIFRGTIESDVLDFDGALDSRLRSDGVTEVRVSTDDGDVILAANGEGQLLAHDVTGLWTCDIATLTCSNSTTGQVLSP